MKLQRRKFLGSSLGIAGALALPKFLRGSSTEIINMEGEQYYLMQSGNEKEDNVMFWGMLEVPQPNKKSKDLEDIKFDHDFYARVNYSSNNKFKEAVCKRFFDYFADSDMRLHVKVIPEVLNTFADKSISQKLEIKVDFIEELLQNHNGVAKIHAKSQSVFGPSKGFKDRFESRTNVQYEAISAKDDNLMQLNDFLVGSLYAMYKGSVTQSVKVALNAYMVDKFGLQNLSPGQSYFNDKIILL